MPVSDEVRKQRSDHMKALHAAKKQQKAQQADEMAMLVEEGLAKPEKKETKRRNQFNGTQQRMSIGGGGIEGYALHIFNDIPGRIEMALASGWEFVSKDEVTLEMSRRVTETNSAVDSKVRFNAGVTDHDQPLHAYLMKLNKNIFDEYKADHSDRLDEIERSMVRNQGIDSHNIGNSYVPGQDKNPRKQAVTIERRAGL